MSIAIMMNVSPKTRISPPNCPSNQKLMMVVCFSFLSFHIFCKFTSVNFVCIVMHVNFTIIIRSSSLSFDHTIFCLRKTTKKNTPKKIGNNKHGIVV
jgi:cellulose synthase/poly-beta-1,6-N-acetylglucosamine synthase-like glycosyltransferase